MKAVLAAIIALCLCAPLRSLAAELPVIEGITLGTPLSAVIAHFPECASWNFVKPGPGSKKLQGLCPLLPKPITFAGRTGRGFFNIFWDARTKQVGGFYLVTKYDSAVDVAKRGRDLVGAFGEPSSVSQQPGANDRRSSPPGENAEQLKLSWGARNCSDNIESYTCFAVEVAPNLEKLILYNGDFLARSKQYYREEYGDK